MATRTACAKLHLGRGGDPAMTVDVTREEFEARVGVLEREVEGEKVVTR